MNHVYVTFQVMTSAMELQDRSKLQIRSDYALNSTKLVRSRDGYANIGCRSAFRLTNFREIKHCRLAKTFWSLENVE